jgi:hypothetical protein
MTLPPGLRYIEDFVNEEEEGVLIKFVDDLLAVNSGESGEWKFCVCLIIFWIF